MVGRFFGYLFGGQVFWFSMLLLGYSGQVFFIDCLEGIFSMPRQIQAGGTLVSKGFLFS